MRFADRRSEVNLRRLGAWSCRHGRARRSLHSARRSCGGVNSGVGMPCKVRNEARMKNYMDGGEAILEAFRRLQDRLHHVIAGFGMVAGMGSAGAAEDSATARARPSSNSWHETLAVNMATGYTLMTGRPQAVLLHAGVGLLQGSMGVHGALQTEVPMVVMSGESQTLGRGSRPRHRAAMVRRPQRRRRRALRRADHQMGARRSPVRTRFTRA